MDRFCRQTHAMNGAGCYPCSLSLEETITRRTMGLAAAICILALFGQSQKSSNFFLGVCAPPDTPIKSAAVAASASQVRTLKPSRPLSRPPGGKDLRGARPGTSLEAQDQARDWPGPGPPGQSLAWSWASKPIPGLVLGLQTSPWPGPGGPSPTQNVGLGPNHQK